MFVQKSSRHNRKYAHEHTHVQAVMIYLTNVFEGNNFSLLTCLHSDIATLRTIMETLKNRNSFNKSITRFKKYSTKMKNHNDIYIYIHIAQLV